MGGKRDNARALAASAVVEMETALLALIAAGAGRLMVEVEPAAGGRRRLLITRGETSCVTVPAEELAEAAYAGMRNGECGMRNEVGARKSVVKRDDAGARGRGDAGTADVESGTACTDAGARRRGSTATGGVEILAAEVTRSLSSPQDSALPLPASPRPRVPASLSSATDASSANGSAGPRRYLTVEQVAERYGISAGAVRQRLCRGRLPAPLAGGRRKLWDERDLNAFDDRQKNVARD